MSHVREHQPESGEHPLRGPYGPVVQRAAQIEAELEKGVKKPFERVVRANIGDLHALGQKPITFIRQSIGTYSPSAGLRVVRRRAADYLMLRDGLSADEETIHLGAGASDLVRSVLEMFAGTLRGKPSGVMIPCPDYPLFSSTLAALGVRPVSYLLDEDRGWALTVEELQISYAAAVAAGVTVRAIVVINPGNPTAQGALYAFPKIAIPQKAQDAAVERGMAPDEFYVLQLLEETGICVVPGSGFGQAAGTFHLRTTILHDEHQFRYMMDRLRCFHLRFVQTYS